MFFLRKARLISVVSITLIILSVILCSLTLAGDYSTPHSFQSGDVISADMMNELFEYIQGSKNTLTEEDLIGTWTCDSYTDIQEGGAVVGWVPDSDDLFQILAGSSIKFNKNDTNYSFTTSAPNPFFIRDSNKFESIFKIVGDSLFFSYDTGGGSMQSPIYSIRKTCKTRFKLTIVTTGGEFPWVIFCNKEGLPPAKPMNLYATKSGLKISLNWVDNSNDETGFKIIRRDTLEGDYDQIGSTTSGANSHNDKVPGPGDYWYRVKATNANGDSLGSNVVKVTIEQ